MTRNQWTNAKHIASGVDFEQHDRWQNAAGPEDIALAHVSELLADRRGGVTIVGDRCAHIYQVGPGGKWFTARPLHFLTSPVTVRPDGTRVYVTHTDSHPRRAVIWPIPTEHDHEAVTLAVRHADHGRLTAFINPLAVVDAQANTLTSTASGDLLLGTTKPAGLFHIDVNGTVTHLVGPPTQGPADLRPDLPSDRVTAVAPLSDGRIAFTHVTHDALRLFVYADGNVYRVRPAGDNPLVPHPLDLGDHPRQRRLRPDVHHLSPIAAAPDGRLITLGFNRSHTPQISLLDIYTGEVQRVATLTDVRPHIGTSVFDPSRVVSAAPWNFTDLLVLADGQLWRIPNVFPAAPDRSPRRATRGRRRRSGQRPAPARPAPHVVLPPTPPPPHRPAPA